MSVSFSEKIDQRLSDILSRRFYGEFFDLLELNGNEKILELGAGQGNLSSLISDRLTGGKLSCINISDYWHNRIRKRLGERSNIEFLLGDIRDMELGRGYDLGIVHYILHDIEETKRASTMRALVSKIKEGGKIFVREPTAKRHGMDSEEVRNIMKGINCEEVYFKLTPSWLMNHPCQAVYLKN